MSSHSGHFYTWLSTFAFAARVAAFLVAVIAPLTALRAQTDYAIAYAITTLAGRAASGDSSGTGSAARFRAPQAVAVDSSGNVYVADSTSHTIRKVTAARVVTTLAGSIGVSGSVDGYRQRREIQ